MVQKLYEAIRTAAAMQGDAAVLRIAATYEPAGGPSSRVYPPTYPTNSSDEAPYLFEERVIDGELRSVVLLDGVASEANRAEEALLRARRAGIIQFPLLELRHEGEAAVTLTSLDWPHRWADAYLRDSLLNGVAFDKTDFGKALRAVSNADASALYAADPGSLVFGAWDSHRKGRQVKFPRCYASEVIGLDAVRATRKAGRLDPLNLVGGAKRDGKGDDWVYVSAAEKVKGERLSEIGHGNVPPNAQHGGVTISAARRMATVSFAGLDRIGFGALSADAAVAGRAVLAAYAILADRLAFGGLSLWLRSGCELVLSSETLTWVGRGEPQVVTVSPAQAVELFEVAVREAASAGLPWNVETVELTPSPALAQAIDFSLTKAAATEKE